MRRCLPILLSGSLALAVPAPGASAQDKPNIVLVFMDNFGWGEPGFNGGGIIRGAETPRLDQIAAEGLRLTNFNVEVQCTPSRSALMTGRYAIRSGNGTVPMGEGVYGLVQWEVTMAEMLSDAGYATGMFGKWHLGDIPGRFPTDQGFDEWYGVANTTDESEYSSQFQFDPDVSGQPMIVEAGRGEIPRDVKPYNVASRRTIDSELTERAIDFMQRSVDAREPFFAFVPFTQPHLPTLPHPDFDGRTGKGHGEEEQGAAEKDGREELILEGPQAVTHHTHEPQEGDSREGHQAQCQLYTIRPSLQPGAAG